ncbi:HNH endonuclease [Amycolatopsis tolypomycina]|uniref:HNH endonuclease n=1 Tax=Amycolatopsis tolypomycina TaxID=208445 RepID=UPI0033B7DAF9
MYFLLPDEVGDDPRWLVLAEGKFAVADALQAAYLRLYSKSAHHMNDGYLTAHDVLSGCRGRKRIVELLTASVLGRSPWLHRRGDTCGGKNCIDSSPPWVEGFEYRLCSFSKRNPTRSEKSRNDAQKADSKDWRLRDLVYARDGGCCRYCGSGPLPRKGTGRAKDRRKVLQFDHIDPDRAAEGGANYVTACGRCNEEKGHRTPAEADLVLRPEPTDAERGALAGRELLLCDLPDNDSDNARDNASDNDHDSEPDNDGGVVATDVATPPPGAVPAGEVCAPRGEQPTSTTPATASEGSGSGRVGQSTSVHSRASPLGPGGQLVRDGQDPDIYHRRSRAPAYPAAPDLPPGGDP